MYETETINYINLTNGIEWLKNADIKNPRFIRIQSTALEQGHMSDVLRNLDNDFLMHLALGHRCVVYDMGARSNDGCSRAMWYGIPWIKYVIERRWFKRKPNEVYLGFPRDRLNMANYFDLCYKKLPTSILRKIDYFKNYLFCNKIFLEGISTYTNNDGDKPYYKNILENSFFK